MSTAPVNYRVEQKTAIISFNNPPLNVLTQDMLDAYIGYLEQARDDDAVRSVIITSDVPGRFCAGLDLNALYRGEKTGGELVERLYVRIAEAQYQLGKPSIAAINGTARGGEIGRASCRGRGERAEGAGAGRKRKLWSVMDK